MTGAGEARGEEDAALTRELELRLRRDGAYDSKTKHRRKALRILREVVRDWMRHVWRSRMGAGRSSSTSPIPEATVLTFGSCEMRVNAPDADIDCLLLAPRGCDRARDFFGTLVATLRGRGDVERVTPIPNVFAPVVKFRLRGVDFDLLFARFPGFTTLPPDTTRVYGDHRDDALLAALDRADPERQWSLRSLNGCRGTAATSRLVPDADAFRLALRFVKRWAKMRGVYGNVFGLLGGASWAVLTARACQLHPNESAAGVISGFFRVFSRWPWPEPVLLDRPDDDPSLAGSKPGGDAVDAADDDGGWDPRRRPRDAAHRMPVIAPTSPRLNTAYNVTAGTFAVVRAELARGDRAFERHRSDSNAHPSRLWDELLRSPRFFEEHRHFLAVDVVSSPEVASEHHAWDGWVESRLRWLVLAVERASAGKLLARPWPHPHAREGPAGTRTARFVALRWDGDVGGFGARGIGTALDLRGVVEEFMTMVRAWPPRKIGQECEVRYQRAPQRSTLAASGVVPWAAAEAYGGTGRSSAAARVGRALAECASEEGRRAREGGDATR
jgi:poly(A) polymerase